MISITYCGPKTSVEVLTPERVSYFFSEKNKFTITPNSWRDLYYIMSMDPSPLYKHFKFTRDPDSKFSDRRIVRDEFDIDPAIQEAQQAREELAVLAQEKAAKKKFYIDGVNLKIAQGILDHIPETLEEDAEAYANGEEVKPTLPTPPVETSKKGRAAKKDTLTESTTPDLITDISLTDTSGKDITTPFTSDGNVPPVTQVEPTVIPPTEPVVELPPVELPTPPVEDATPSNSGEMVEPPTTETGTEILPAVGTEATEAKAETTEDLIEALETIIDKTEDLIESVKDPDAKEPEITEESKKILN